MSSGLFLHHQYPVAMALAAQVKGCPRPLDQPWLLDLGLDLDWKLNSKAWKGRRFKGSK